LIYALLKGKTKKMATPSWQTNNATYNYGYSSTQAQTSRMQDDANWQLEQRANFFRQQQERINRENGGGDGIYVDDRNACYDPTCCENTCCQVLIVIVVSCAIAGAVIWLSIYLSKVM
jgi:hypothetical protein